MHLIDEDLNENILNTETTIKERPNVHPHWLTGAKGFDTTVFGRDSMDFKLSKNLEDILYNDNHVIATNLYNDEAMQFEVLSENSNEVGSLNWYNYFRTLKIPECKN